MPAPHAALDPAHPPTRLEEAVDGFESMSTGLVLLEPYPLPEVRQAIAAFHGAVRTHSTIAESRLSEELAPHDLASRSLLAIVRSDHRWFEISFEQMDWFLRIAEGDGHGGNRQALGQYGRILAEAVRRHLSDERRLTEVAPTSAGKP